MAWVRTTGRGIPRIPGSEKRGEVGRSSARRGRTDDEFSALQPTSPRCLRTMTRHTRGNVNESLSRPGATARGARTRPARVAILHLVRRAAFPVPLLVLVLLLLSLVRRLLLLPLSRFLRSRDANNSPPRFLRVHQQRSQVGLALSFGNGSAGRRNVGG